MNVLILTQYLENYLELGNLTGANKREYAARHSYDYHEQIGHYYDFGVPRTANERFDFQRVKLIYDVLFGETLGKRYDVVWWQGCDTFITNMIQTMEAYLEGRQGSVFIAKNCNNSIYNNDSVIFRNSPSAKLWLEFVLSKEPDYRNLAWESQSVYIDFADLEEWKGVVVAVPLEDINSHIWKLHGWPETTMGNWKKGDWLVHLPGLEKNVRIDTFNSPMIQDSIVR